MSGAEGVARIAIESAADLETVRRAGADARVDALVLIVDTQAGPVDPDDAAAAVATAGAATVALIGGGAAAVSTAVAAAADIAIASEGARFPFDAVAPDGAAADAIAAALGERAARRWLMTGETMDAAAARRLGLVHMVAMDVQLGATLDGVVAALRAKGARAVKSRRRARLTGASCSPSS